MKLRFFLVMLTVLTLLAGAACAATLPDDLEAIEASAFEGDEALTGLLTLPGGVQAIGSRAFAATGLHALVIPQNCATVETDLLAEGQAAYVYLMGADTVLSGTAFADTAFVFGPASGTASGMAGFYAAETLQAAEGFYFSVGQDEAIALCAVDGTAVNGDVTLPKFVNGQPLRDLSALNLLNCDGLTGLLVPSYLTIPEGLDAQPYDAMTITAPQTTVPECEAGEEMTWTTEVTNAYGSVAYIWTFDVDGVVSSTITAEPAVTWTPTTQGSCTASVTAVDALDDRAISARSSEVTITAPKPVYRALLVGNLYTGTDSELPGCDTDVAAMRTVLSSMPGTDYDVTTRIEVTASEIKSAISSTFADARSCDVSLFYYSGHGTSSGSLVGTGNSVISVSELRTLLDTIPGTKIVIIDACYSGNMIGDASSSSGSGSGSGSGSSDDEVWIEKSDRSAADPSAFTSAVISAFSALNKDNLATDGYIVMTACSSTQTSASLSDGTIWFGAFTYGVCYGSGYDEWQQSALGSLPADANSDQAISLGEAYSVAVDRVAWLKTMVTTMNQSAQYYGDTAFVLWGK